MGTPPVLDDEDMRQPDWFRKTKAEIKHILDERNRLYALRLAIGDRRKNARAFKPWRQRRGRHHGKVM